MPIATKLSEDLKQAMKKGEALRVSTVRLIKAAIKNKEIELGHAVNEGEFFAVLATMVKQRRESIVQFKQGGREDLAQKEGDEIALINAYLPQPLSDEEVTALIMTAIKKTGANGPQGMGLVMKELKEKTTGRIDGKLLADKVKVALVKTSAHEPEANANKRVSHDKTQSASFVTKTSAHEPEANANKRVSHDKTQSASFVTK